MSCNQNAAFGEKEQITDLLFSEKYLTEVYNTYLLECATPEVMRSLGELLVDTHSAQQHLFEEMNSRGWYPVNKAPDQKLQSSKQKFSAKVSN